MSLVVPQDTKLGPQYDITVRSSGDSSRVTVYRTIRILSDVGADSSLGRGTRVWEVRKLMNGVPQESSFALKDVWVHEDRVPEHEIIQWIKKTQPTFDKHFLTVVDAGFVPARATEPSVVDNTFRTLRHEQRLQITAKPIHIWPQMRFHPTRSSSSSTHFGIGGISHSRSSVGHHHHEPPQTPKGHREKEHINDFPRQHYRVVFQEIGIPVHDLRTFQDVWIAIEGGYKG
jgi:hypothetical protein